MSTIEASGSITGIVGSEVTIGSITTTNHIRALGLDVTNLAAGEIAEVRAYAPSVSAGGQVLIELVTFTGTAAKPHTQSNPFLMPFGGQFTVKQTNGSARTFNYYVILVDV